MPPVKKRPVKRARAVRVTPAALESMVEERAEAIVHRHNIFDLKMIVALAVIGIASMAMNALASTTSTTSTPNGAPVVAVSGGRLVVSARSDYYTNPRIVTPNSTAPSTTIDQTILGVWDISAELESVALRKVSLSAINPDFTVRTTATEFGVLNLYNNSGILLASGNLVKGTVQFNLDNYVVEPGKPQSLTLKGVVNGSGVMKENSIIRFGVNLQVPNPWQAVGMSSLKDLGFTDFKFRNPNYAIGALTPFFLYHNSVPRVSSSWASWSVSNKPVAEESKIFPINIQTIGERDLRISKIMVNISASGMVNTGVSSTTGVINGFKLYESDSQNNLGKLLASSSNCLVAAKVGGPTVGTVTVPGIGTCSIGNVFVSFDQSNDENGSFNTLFIPTPEDRRFMVVANTTKALVGNGGKSISILPQIMGNTGPFPTSNPKVATWSGGGLFYHYTPKGKTENLSAYNQTDNYPVKGSVMNFSL